MITQLIILIAIYCLYGAERENEKGMEKRSVGRREKVNE